MEQIILLTRDIFRESVFKRDGYKCVICGEEADLNEKGIPTNLDAHHIIERRLWGKSQGYMVENGATLCRKHHLEAEMTTLECDDIREAAGIKIIVIPPHFYEDVEYDKWGNQILKNGTRLKGELFDDASVQKILGKGNVLGEFTHYVKYPRTYHLPWSQGMNRDDRMMTDVDIFEGEEVMICEKLDGENTSCYTDRVTARSLETSSHPSRSWVKNLWAQFGYNIPEGWRVCGENMYAKHAIHYTNALGNALETYFYMFSIWDDSNMCLSWDETEEWAELLGLTLVPVYYKGIYDKDFIDELNKKMEADTGTVEGYVIRLAREYHIVSSEIFVENMYVKIMCRIIMVIGHNKK
jgi:hypothetical protein